MTTDSLRNKEIKQEKCPCWRNHVFGYHCPCQCHTITYKYPTKSFGTLANADGVEDKSKPSGRSGK